MQLPACGCMHGPHTGVWVHARAPYYWAYSILGDGPSWLAAAAGGWELAQPVVRLAALETPPSRSGALPASR
jgi:hypothetical protein